MKNKINSEIEHILKNYRKIAVVGLSDNPQRPSFSVAKSMLKNGYEVFPVNPKLDAVLGRKSYASVSDIPEKIELVNIFRRPEEVEPIVKEAIKIGAPAVWMQLGVVNPEAAELALNAGLKVVMDRCWKIEFYLHKQES